VREVVRFKKRSDVAYSTLITIVMMCLNDIKEIVRDETSIDILFSQEKSCTVVLKVTMLYGLDIIKLCETLQKQIIIEIEAMTHFKVENVHITVQRLVYQKRD
jgi:hypothetical protein